MDDTIFSLAAIISQTGFAIAAWRLANKIATGLKTHEDKDEEFHAQVRYRLGIPSPSKAGH